MAFAPQVLIDVGLAVMLFMTVAFVLVSLYASSAASWRELRTRLLLPALVVGFAVQSAGCIAGMGRVGAEPPRNFRAMIIDEDLGYGWVRAHEGDVGNRMGLAIGVLPAIAVATQVDSGSPMSFGGSSVVQFMMASRRIPMAFGTGWGLDISRMYSPAKTGQLFAAYGDLRGALALTKRLSFHFGLGPAYGTYHVASGTTNVHTPWKLGGHAVLGISWIFKYTERSSWGLRVELDSTLVGSQSVAAQDMRPAATMLGMQLVWLTGR
jgi:hypothetical protein